MKSILMLFPLFLSSSILFGDTVEFDSDRWNVQNGQVRHHLGRTCFTGIAFLEDLEFENGVIEVDVASNGGRSYPGLAFRVRSRDDCERFYIRPHRSNGCFEDALQYTPVIRGVAPWQLYSGAGFTAAVVLPMNEWVHVKMEIHGSQARVFVGDMNRPALVIPRLKHGAGKGTIGVWGENSTTAYFSNFSFRKDDSLVFEAVPEVETPLGMITEWALSPAFKRSELDPEAGPAKQGLDRMAWKEVRSEPSGLLDISRHQQWQPGLKDWIYARAVIHADQEEVRRFHIGFSDMLYLFINDALIFQANSAYRSRHPAFSGIIGLHDAVYLPLKKGRNELVFLVAERFGGWGVMCRDGEAEILHKSMSLLWEKASGVDYPESAAYDRDRGLLYVSNFFSRGNEYISKLKPDGEVVEQRWITGLNRPTGICLTGDTLYAVERQNLVEIDVEQGKITARHAIPRAVFPNDVAADDRGTLYLSDSRKGVIYRFRDRALEVWLTSDELRNPNGLCVDGDQLMVGCSGDGTLKAIDMESQKIHTIASLGEGAIMDGLQCDGQGNYIQADYRGRVYRITPSGEKTVLLDLTARGILCADLLYLPEENVLFLPTLESNRLLAYSL